VEESFDLRGVMSDGVNAGQLWGVFDLSTLNVKGVRIVLFFKKKKGR